MIKEALLALNEKGGSSPHAIDKYMEEKHEDVLPGNYKKMLGVQLKNCVANEKLIKVKVSFKLSDASKKQEKKVVTKTKTVKSVVADEKNAKKRKTPPPTTSSSEAKFIAVASVPKSKATVKKSETAVAPKKKKTAVPAKKTGPAKKVAHVKRTKRATPVKAKQPKLIKSHAAKRDKKTAAA
ncbi:hypothetical protein MKX01_010531 [Papaver californicum]|nr:hypothetical protein MKX01_010531 [Papaver californicum]